MADAQAIITAQMETQTLLNKLLTHLQANNFAPNVTATVQPTARNPTKPPTPFKGEASDVERFLRFYTAWALGSGAPMMEGTKAVHEQWITTALTYMEGNASSWAAPHLDQIRRSLVPTDQTTATTPRFPFEGDWDKFVEAFKRRFRPGSDEDQAVLEMEALKHGNRSVALFCAEFRQIWERTGLSETDAMVRFKRKLNERDRTWLNLSSLVKKPATLAELTDQVIANEQTMTDTTKPSSSSRYSAPAPAAAAADPYAMDIDATSTKPGPSGRSLADFQQAMRGRCYGCGSTAHIKRDGGHGGVQCPWCRRMGHKENVCQDKFLGKAKGGGLRRTQQVRATASQEFDVCAGSAPSSSAPASSSTTIAASAPPRSDLDRFEMLQRQQADLVARLTQLAGFTNGGQ